LLPAASVVVTETSKESAAARLAPATAIVQVPSSATGPADPTPLTVTLVAPAAWNSPVTMPVTSTFSPASAALITLSAVIESTAIASSGSPTSPAFPTRRSSDLLLPAASVVVIETSKESAAARLAPATAIVQVPSSATVPACSAPSTVSVITAAAWNTPVTVPVTSTFSPASAALITLSEVIESTVIASSGASVSTP